MQASKTKIDKAGLALSKMRYRDDIEYIELEDVFDEYRKEHLSPLTEVSIDLQNWLSDFASDFFVAQRLKRKPQIISKLKRLNVRLTQLQDVGGARIVVEDDGQVDKIYSYIKKKLEKQSKISIVRCVDYRNRGRDVTGYRALHLVLSLSGIFVELQVRSKIQHYWAELIERTSVVYGFTLKEQKGDENVINYFQQLSNVFYEIEAGRDVTPDKQISLERLREQAEEVIKASDTRRVFESFVHDDILKMMESREKARGGGFKNWLMIFDWNSGSFIDWSDVGRKPDEVIKAYVDAESKYHPEDGFEVVLIGASNVSIIRQTHSHYFGIKYGSSILENLDQSVVCFSSKMDIDTGARRILWVLNRRRAWGGNVINVSTLKNHFCKNVLTFDDSLTGLLEKGLISYAKNSNGVSLDLGKKTYIDSYL